MALIRIAVLNPGTLEMLAAFPQLSIFRIVLHDFTKTTVNPAEERKQREHCVGCSYHRPD